MLSKETIRNNCRYLVGEQCVEQCGDNEDLTEEEFRALACCGYYYTVCPYSQYAKEDNMSKGEQL